MTRPETIRTSFRVEFTTDDRRLQARAAIAFQEQLRQDWKGGRVGAMRIREIVGMVVTDPTKPLLSVVMDALVERGWRIEGNTQEMIAPDSMGGERYTLAAAIDAQTFREIGEAD